MKGKSKLTLEMTTEESMYLKMVSAKLGISMKEFLLIAAFERIEEMEDEWLAEKSRETLANIQSGKEQTIPWEEMKK